MATSFARVLRRVKDDPAGLLPASTTRAALARSPRRFRCRKLPPKKLIELMLVQAVHANAPVEQLKHLSTAMKGVSPQAFCKARQRLPLELLRGVAVELAAEAINASEDQEGVQARWDRGPGHRVLLLDAFSFRTGNHPALAEAFGRPMGGGSQTAGKPADQRRPTFPFGHALARVDHRLGVIVDLCVGPGHQHDLHGVEEMHGHLLGGDLLIGDPHVSSVMHFSLAVANGVHLLTRAKLKKDGEETPLPSHAPAGLKVVVESDGRCTPRHGGKDPTWMEEPTFAGWSRTATHRRIVDRLAGVGFRTRRIALHTTLLDEEVDPALEWVKLYLLRWHVDFRHLKATMKAAVPRGRSGDVVHKERWSLVLADNAVSLAVAEAARQKKVAPGRVSFLDAMRWMQTYLDGRGKLPRWRWRT